ncbi:right-handed parallel beta-helix repeat-containing protein [Dokdonella fugitiva]|uniref:Parallel beta helix pectate lyase-like protein n=1 Tax=Dokdonella fugitiva TaxID=328517 RepID=A0A4R2I2U1_9GAMM|nr:right-handed parallel beta-helix repeat-containing protein [Dokdonella fugitiva]TCO38354.1 parallel beta helix pectate lyase-like protein [Dokdonella fugitiva]
MGMCMGGAFRQPGMIAAAIVARARAALRGVGVIGASAIILGLLHAGHASAAIEQCVGTVDELATALVLATAPTGQTFVIKLKQGVYHVGGSFLAQWHEYHAMQLLGGYDADCSGRAVRPSNTVIDGDGGGLEGLRMHGDLRIEGLRFQHVGGNRELFIDTWDGTEDLDISIFSNEFLGIGVFTSCYDCDGVEVQFVNNLVSGAPSDGFGALEGYSDDVYVYAANNTIVGSGERGIHVQSDGINTFADNVVWNNPTRDIWVDGDTDGNPGSARYYDNLYGDRYGDEAPGSYGTLHSDPLFVGAGNFRLQPASPGVNSGAVVNPVASVDLDGHARVIGSAPDRGAYEAQVDDTIPATLTVTTTADGGAGSLRQAILDANANPDYSFINFAIPGACPHVIAPSSALPAITQGARIDAYSQPGSAANTRTFGDDAVRCVILDGGNVIATGLDFTGATTTQFWLQGIAIGGFTGSGLRLSGGTDDLVWGNQFGGKVGNLMLAGNGTGITLDVFAHSASIGGEAAVQRNVIAGSPGTGISVRSTGLFSSTGNEIVGNLIGAWGTGATAAGNQVGIRLATSGNVVRDNVIVDNTLDGVQLAGAGATGNTVDHNRIGRTQTLCIPVPVPFCFPDAAPNQRYGIRFEGGAHDNVASGNSVWNSGQMGISVGGTGKGNRLSANSVYASRFYGIDLDGSGLNDNDADAGAANLPDRGLNYPAIARAYGGSRIGWVEGSLASIPDSYQIQVFTSATADNEPNGEGEVYLRTGIATIFDAPPGQNGNTNFRIAFASPDVALAGRRIALTAIDSAGNTSEFSFSAPYLCDVIFRNGVDDAEGDACAQ